MNLDWNSTVEMVDFRVASTVPTDIRLPSTCEERTSTTAILEWGQTLQSKLSSKGGTSVQWFLFKSSRRRQTYAAKGKYNIYRGTGRWFVELKCVYCENLVEMTGVSQPVLSKNLGNARTPLAADNVTFRAYEDYSSWNRYH